MRELGLLLLVVAEPLGADDAPRRATLVELFTSQG
jgi:hypothetical protein